jgi:hypothetical protein
MAEWFERMKKTIITLTAIPPRFPYLAETLGSLLSQRADITAVEVWLPRKYRRFDFDPATALPKVPEGVTINITAEDMGPATKILPSVKRHRGQDVNLIFCDDDKVYDPGWAGRLLAESAAHPGYCIVEEGGDISHNSTHDWHGPELPRANRPHKDWKYRLRRALSLGRWKPRKNQSSGYVDILEGWGGVLVRPEFFADGAFDIAPKLWMVDDIWLSGQLALNNVPIWLTVDEDIRTKGSSNEVRHAALRFQTVEGKGRKALNQAGIDYFRDTHGIWK